MFEGLRQMYQTLFSGGHGGRKEDQASLNRPSVGGKAGMLSGPDVFDMPASGVGVNLYRNIGQLVHPSLFPHLHSGMRPDQYKALWHARGFIPEHLAHRFKILILVDRGVSVATEFWPEVLHINHAEHFPRHACWREAVRPPTLQRYVILAQLGKRYERMSVDEVELPPDEVPLTLEEVMTLPCQRWGSPEDTHSAVVLAGSIWDAHPEFRPALWLKGDSNARLFMVPTDLAHPHAWFGSRFHKVIPIPVR